MAKEGRIDNGTDAKAAGRICYDRFSFVSSFDARLKMKK